MSTRQENPIAGKHNIRWTIILALLIGLLHLAFVIISSNKLANFPFAYHSLFQWDGKHYKGIMDKGYYAKNLEWPLQRNAFDEKTNVAFFPGYPLLASGLKTILLLQTDIILILTSQIAFVILLLYTLLILEEFGLSFIERVIGVLLFISYPTAFFLVSSLPEAVLLGSMAGYLYWTRKKGNFSVIAIVHGIIMTGTKVFGIPMVIIPVIASLVRRNFAVAKKQAITVLLSLIGAISFLIYCQLSFGHWNLYFAVQKSGWNIDPQYMFFLDYQTLKTLFAPWTIQWPTYIDYTGKTIVSTLNIESFYAISLLIWWCCFWPIIEWITITVLRSHSWRDRITYYVGTIISLYLIIAATLSNGLQSAIRYSLLPHFLLILTIAHWYSSLPKKKFVFLVYICALLFFFISFTLQFGMAHTFTNGEWAG